VVEAGDRQRTKKENIIQQILLGLLNLPVGCLEKLEFSSEDKERENQKAQHTQGI